MSKNPNKLSIASTGLNNKLKISFCLMSVLPLLVSGYLVSNYILPKAGLKIDIAASLLISGLISVVGYLLIKQVFDRIVSISTNAKKLASEDKNYKIESGQEDEVGDLSFALNHLTQHIRSNMDELKSYSEKARDINLEVQKRVIALSSLLQVSSLISQGTRLEDILKVIIEKSRLLANSDTAYLLFLEDDDNFYMKIVDGMNLEQLLGVVISPQDSLFREAISAKAPLILDKQSLSAKDLLPALYEKFKLKNTLAMPVSLKGKVIALIGIGNARESFLYKKEDIELLDLFAKNISIAIDNDSLMHRVEKLEIKDQVTGLYNEAFIRNFLQDEIKRAIAHQRPCALILLNIDNFNKFHENFGPSDTETAIKKIIYLIRESVSEIDRIGRTGDNEFAIVLPEVNKRRAQGLAEEIRKKIEFAFSEEQDPNRKVTISGGVSENPLDGIDSKQLMNKAKELLSQAKKMGRNRIVSFIDPQNANKEGHK